MSQETTDSSEQASQFNIFLKKYGIREEKSVDGPIPDKILRQKSSE